MNILKAIYNFLVGDIVILVGVLFLVLLLALLSNIAALTALRPVLGGILVIGIVIILAATLNRETSRR